MPTDNTLERTDRGPRLVAAQASWPAAQLGRSRRHNREAGMTDDETNSLLRELIALQKESLELTRRSNDAYEQKLREYVDSADVEHQSYARQSEAYGQELHQHQERARALQIAETIRTVALVVIAACLVYLSIAGIRAP